MKNYEELYNALVYELERAKNLSQMKKSPDLIRQVSFKSI